MASVLSSLLINLTLMKSVNRCWLGELSRRRPVPIPMRLRVEALSGSLKPTSSTPFVSKLEMNGVKKSFVSIPSDERILVKL